MKKILYPLIILCCFAACKPDEDCEDCGIIDHSFPPAEDTIYVSEELKNYYFFGEGSWWVYKRTDTNAIIYDTATLVKRESRIVYERIYYPTAWEYTFTGILHSHYNAIPGGVESKLQINTENLNGLTDRIGMYSQRTLFKNVIDFFSIPIDSISILNKSNGNSYLIDTNSLFISNYTFNNTLHLQHGFIPDFFYDIYLTKNVGLTKYRNAGDNTEWELISYEIKP
jgi:hypothetical protein